MVAKGTDWGRRLDLLERWLRGIRRRLLSVFLVFGVGSALSFWFRGEVMRVLFAPAGGLLSPTGQPIFTGPTEMFEFAVRLSLIGGVVTAAPVALFHVTRLLGPFLDRRQRWLLALLLTSALVSYLLGAAFAYFVLLPLGFRFLLEFGAGEVVAYIRVTEYFDLAMALVLWMGVLFELPLAMTMAVKLKVVRYERLKQVRKYVAPTALILGAIISPTADWLNSLLMSAPIIALYEVGLFLAFLARTRQKKPHKGVVP